MDYGWDGIGFLLLSKGQNRFDALIGCLKAKKFSKFVDIMTNFPREVVLQTDGKGRNLLLLLMRHVGDENNPKSEEVSKFLEIVNLLTAKPIELKN